MKALRVNADYEVILSGTKNPSPLINQSLEFLALYLEDRPLLTTKSYSKDYLDHVEKISGQRPWLVSSGESENWWGCLKDLELEKKLNSKTVSAAFGPFSRVIKHRNEINLDQGMTYLVKGPFGMSGKGSFLIKKGQEAMLSKRLQETGELVIEPLFNREKDFSHYVFPEGKMVCYENIINEKFQYQGTLFNNLNDPTVKGLRFYREVSESEWRIFFKTLEKVKSCYLQYNSQFGYSVDSFTFNEKGKKRIRAVSEINYRQTMGLVTWRLAQKFSGTDKWASLILGKPLKRKNAFAFIRDKVSTLSGVYYLSPGDTRFDVFLLSASDEEKGKELLRVLKELLPDSELAVSI